MADVDNFAEEGKAAAQRLNDALDTVERVIEKRELFKLDVGKPPLELLPAGPLAEIARVLEFGAKKYERQAWRTNAGEWSRLVSAALRHIHAFNEGETIDQESGRPHLAHAACCLLFLLEYERKAIGIDDRFKPEAR